jgi:hypothetical protein
MWPTQRVFARKHETKNVLKGRDKSFATLQEELLLITINKDFSNCISMQIKISEKFLQWLENEKLPKQLKTSIQQRTKLPKRRFLLR